MFDLATERDKALREIDYPRVAAWLGWYFEGFFCTFDVEH